MDDRKTTTDSEKKKKTFFSKIFSHYEEELPIMYSIMSSNVL